MDPNANLEEQRRIIANWRKLAADGFDPVDDLERLAELTEALDDWLSAGGFLPKAWQR